VSLRVERYSLRHKKPCFNFAADFIRPVSCYFVELIDPHSKRWQSDLSIRHLLSREILSNSLSRTMYEAVIFDCDGTLVDSEIISLGVLVDYISQFGLQMAHDEAVARFAGTNLSFVLAELSDRLTSPLPENHVAEFRQRQMECLRSNLQPIPGAAELLATLKIPFCVASNAPRAKIELCLETTGLDRHFDQTRIHSAYDIQIWKPEPDLFYKAADSLGVRRERCVVIEDSLPGVQAGLAAGMQVFAIDANGSLRKKIQGAHFVNSLQELALELC
jgi:HAD superfamily hydrolase (TIGR01509 family)